MADYIISLKAKEDLRGIADFTIDKFGETQSLRYAVGLEDTMQTLADRPDLGRNYVTLNNNSYYRYNFKSHVIFYHTTPTGIFIVRVLGSKMDFLRHLN